jgi:hypothetical protein
VSEDKSGSIFLGPIQRNKHVRSDKDEVLEILKRANAFKESVLDEVTLHEEVMQIPCG